MSGSPGKAPELAGIGRSMEGRGAAAVEARGSKVGEARRLGSRTSADAAAARPSSGALLRAPPRLERERLDKIEERSSG